MCGIGGIYKFNQNQIDDIDEKSLDKMKFLMARRGPDAQSKTSQGRIGLVHTRLAIVDVDERSNQPMESESWVMVFNGEIINYRQIKKELSNKHQFKTSSDSEVLLIALEEWGIDKTLKAVAGMFSILAYNKKDQCLYAVRDHLGIKPLFYYQHPNHKVYLASTVATIANAVPGFEILEDKSAIASFFILGATFTESSALQGIIKVPPATYLTFEPNGALKKTKYWTPEYNPQFSFDELISIVKEYALSDVKSALFMSGGIDSSFLGTVIKNMDFFHLESHELCYAKQVAKKMQCPLIRVKPTLKNYFDGISNVMRDFGEPLMSCGIPNTVSQEITNRGYKMAISANGADELLFGYPRTPIPNLKPEQQLKLDMLPEKWFGLQLSHIFRNKNHFKIENFEHLLPSIQDIGLSTLKNLQLPDFPLSASQRWLELQTYVLNDLNPTLDASSMYNSLEVRVPFLDHRIVQGLLSWDSDRILTSEYGRKSPLKAYLSNYFDENFLQRPKLGFSMDEKIYTKITKKINSNFNALIKNGFVTINEENKGKYYYRDLEYLKNSLSSYHQWKQVFFSSKLTNTDTLAA